MKNRVTVESYRQEVLLSDIPVLVEFFAAWCGKCAMMEDVVEELAGKYAGVMKVCQIEIEESADLAAKFEVEVVPTFVLFQCGKPIAAAGGVLTRESLEDMIQTAGRTG